MPFASKNDRKTAARWALSLGLMAAMLFSSCVSFSPKGHFDARTVPPAPDYSDPNAWAALPFKKDSADIELPLIGIFDRQSIAKADVFYLHPTTLTGSKRSERQWNGDVRNEKLNLKTDRGAVRYQASIFNSAGRVFAPRYRQMHIHGFHATHRKRDAEAAFALAGSDVRAAFEHYLKNWNDGRPVILVGHSQGAAHGIALASEFFDGKPMQKQLVAAYLVGWPLRRHQFKNLQPCDSPDETGCVCGWRTFREGHRPKWINGPDFFATNPLNWSSQPGLFVPRTENRGAVLLKFKSYPALCDAIVAPDGYLWTHRPKFKGSFLIRTKNYHAGDLNLFYFNVRENAERRATAKSVGH